MTSHAVSHGRLAAPVGETFLFGGLRVILSGFVPCLHSLCSHTRSWFCLVLVRAGVNSAPELECIANSGIGIAIIGIGIELELPSLE